MEREEKKKKDDASDIIARDEYRLDDKSPRRVLFHALEPENSVAVEYPAKNRSTGDLPRDYLSSRVPRPSLLSAGTRDSSRKRLVSLSRDDQDTLRSVEALGR